MSYTIRAALAAAIAATSIPAAQAMPMGGSLTAQVDGQSAQPIGKGGQIRLTKTATGTNAGPGSPLDGATVRFSDVAVLKDGQGTLKGTITFVTPSGTTSSPYTGRVATDASGRVTAEGAFTTTKATGDFAGLKGRGTFSVAFTSPTSFTGQWQGDFQAPAQRTSRRD
jgi:hypothetical protein